MLGVVALLVVLDVGCLRAMWLVVPVNSYTNSYTYYGYRGSTWSLAGVSHRYWNNVMWYEKIDVVSNKLEYWVPRTETQPSVQSSRYLIPININMHQMLGQNNVVPRLRILSRHNGLEQSANNNQTRIDHWHREELANVWNMDSEIRVAALAYSSK